MSCGTGLASGGTRPGGASPVRKESGRIVISADVRSGGRTAREPSDFGTTDMMRRLRRQQAFRSGQKAADFGLQVILLAFQAALLTAAVLFISSVAIAEESGSSAPIDEAAAKRTAVALNYCRSAFYRIGKNPTQQVLAEERQKILNNLNLTSIQDEEVVDLYSSVLEEIGSIRIADRERQVVDAGYGKGWQSLATFTAFGVLTDVTDMNYASLVKRGATSWWDYRGLQVNRDMEQWKVEKNRMTAVIAKSSSFLDASWKLARKRQIPDRWLLRDADFQRLELALQERDPVVRQRLLKRMEPFMECYPPYWYYLGRSQQARGEFRDAEATFVRLVALGDGHFRRDEMLAASMANVAAIRDYLKLAGAREAAEQSLAYTTDSWEVNLTAAMVLMRHGEIELAEDAVLRNLDSELETAQSGVAILAVYARLGDSEKILARLNADPTAVSRTPIPVLLRCAAAMKGQPLPTVMAERLKSSLHGYFGRDDFVLVADPAWEFRSAQFAVDGPSQARPTLHVTERVVTVQFDRSTGAAHSKGGGSEFDVLLKYSDDFQVKLTLHRDDSAPPTVTVPQTSRFGQFLAFVSDRERERETQPAREVMRISAVETAGTLIAFDGPVRSLAEAEPRSVASPEIADSPGDPTDMTTVPVSVTTESGQSDATVTLGPLEPLDDPSP